MHGQPGNNTRQHTLLRISIHDIVSMGVCTTTHWQTSGRLLQELNGCTVWKILPKSVVWTFDAIDNDFGINDEFSKYLKEGCF